MAVISRAEAVKRLRFIKPATSFRSAYAYDNVLYMVAGQLIEAVSGQTWEDYVREHVLQPAGMTKSTSDSDRRLATANRAYPHARPGRVRGTGPLQLLDERDELGRAAAPAGGLAISANDMSKWLVLQLAHGKLPSGERLFSEAAHAAMWKPEVLQPIGPLPEALKLAEPMFQAYALGWGVRDYRGTKIITHGGAVLGFQSVVTLIPSKNIGLAIEINSEDGEIVLGLMYELLDHYLGFSRNDWPEKYSAFKQERLAGALKALRCEVGQAREGRAFTAAGTLRRHVCGSLVWEHRSRRPQQRADDRLQAYAAHGRYSRALAVRHVHHASRRQDDRAGLRELCVGC